MKCQSTFVYILLGVAVLGLLLGASEDVADALSRSRAPLGERLQRTVDRAAGQSRVDYTGVQVVIHSPELGKWSGAAGTASNLSQEPMSQEHLFGIGSISKIFVATVILQLMEEEQVDLDSLIGLYLPESVVSGTPNSNQITVRMLLNHTSGIAEWTTPETDIQVAEDLSFVWDLEYVLNLVAEHEPVFSPGEGHSYSNTNYTLLGMIIEAITGNWWGMEVQGRILVPLGLEHTMVRAPGDREIPETMARGYARLEGDLFDVTTADPSMAGAAGGNAMLSTTSELAVFIEALLDGRLFSSRETLAAMLEWYDAPDDNGFPYWYGLGIEKYRLGDLVLLGHAGGAVGFSTVMYRSAEDDLTIVATLNSIGLVAAYMDLLLPMLKELER